MPKIIGIIALVAFVAAALIGMTVFHFIPTRMVTMIILPMWGLGFIADCGDRYVQCASWGDFTFAPWWGLPFAISLCYGWAVALGCLVWHKWDSIQAAERKFSADRAANRERKRAERKLHGAAVNKHLADLQDNGKTPIENMIEASRRADVEIYGKPKAVAFIKAKPPEDN